MFIPFSTSWNIRSTGLPKAKVTDSGPHGPPSPWLRELLLARALGRQWEKCTFGTANA